MDHSEFITCRKPDFNLCQKQMWPRFMYAPIRVQFKQAMGVARVPVCTNQSSVYAGDGCGQGSCMHQSEFSLCKKWAWPRFMQAPIRVQFMQEMGMAEVHVGTNQSSVPQSTVLFVNCSSFPVREQTYMSLKKIYNVCDTVFSRTDTGWCCMMVDGQIAFNIYQPYNHPIWHRPNISKYFNTDVLFYKGIL